MADTSGVCGPGEACEDQADDHLHCHHKGGCCHCACKGTQQTAAEVERQQIKDTIANALCNHERDTEGFGYFFRHAAQAEAVLRMLKRCGYVVQNGFHDPSCSDRSHPPQSDEPGGAA